MCNLKPKTSKKLITALDLLESIDYEGCDNLGWMPNHQSTSCWCYHRLVRVQRLGIDTQSSTTPDPGYRWESNKLTVDTTNGSQEVSPFPAGDHKAHINRRAQRHSKHNIFCPENVICLLALLHILKCSPEHFYHCCKH